MPDPATQPRRFLTIVRWPDGYERADVAQLLAEQAGLDEATVRMRLGQPPPMIFGLVTPQQADAAIAALIDAGGDALAPSIDDLAAFGPSHKIKDLRLNAGGLAADLWTGASVMIDPGTIQILVRAQLSESETTVVKPASGPLDVHLGPMPTATGFGITGAMGLGIMMSAAYEETPATETRVTNSYKLDVHLDDGRVFQIDGDKFAFQILGPLRGHSDLVNIDKMCELLTHMSTDPIVDPYFPLWRPPAGYERLRIRGPRMAEEDPAFVFYSRWAALVYRHVLGI